MSQYSGFGFSILLFLSGGILARLSLPSSSPIPLDFLGCDHPGIAEPGCFELAAPYGLEDGAAGDAQGGGGLLGGQKVHDGPQLSPNAPAGKSQVYGRKIFSVYALLVAILIMSSSILYGVPFSILSQTDSVLWIVQSKRLS